MKLSCPIEEVFDGLHQKRVYRRLSEFDDPGRSSALKCTWGGPSIPVVLSNRPLGVQDLPATG